MTKLKTLLLREHPWPEARAAWGMAYESGDDCRLFLDDVGQAHIYKNGEHAILPAHAIRSSFAVDAALPGEPARTARR